MDKPILLICSCINVFAPSKISNAEIRKKQYIDSLIFFILNSDIDRFIIVENTNTSWVTNELKILTATKDKIIEELIFTGDKLMSEKHSIGYSHLEMVNYAFSNSKLLNTKDSLLIMDGRHKVLNINEIYQNLINEHSAFIPEIHRFKKNRLADLRLYLLSRSVFFDYIWPIRFELSYERDGWIERLIDEMLEQKKFKFDTLNTLPRFVGQQGSTGANWDGNNYYAFWFKKTIISLFNLLKY